MKLAQKMMTSSAVMLLEHLLKVAATFFVTPLMAHGLGTEQYGLWLLAMSMIGYLGLIDFGVTLAGSRFIARYVGADDEQKLTQTIFSLRDTYRKLALFSLAGTFLLTIGSFWFFRHETWEAELVTILFALGLSMTLRLWLRLPAALLKGHIAYVPLVWASIARTIVQTGGVLLVLHFRPGLLLLTLVSLAADFVEVIFQIVAARRYYPKEKRPAHRNQEQSEIFRYAVQSLGGSISSAMRGQVPPMAIGWGLGVASIPVYSIAMRLASIVEDAFCALFGGQWLSAFSQMEEKSDGLEMRRLWTLRLLRYAACLGTTAMTALIVLAKPFILLWLGPLFVSSYDFLCIFAFSYAINLIQWPSRALIGSSPYYPIYTRWTLLASIFLAVSCFIFVPTFGVNSVAWLIAIHHLVVFAGVMTYYNCRIIQVSYWQYWYPPLKVSLIIGLTGWAYSHAAARWLVPDYWKLFQAGLGLTAVCLLASYAFGLNADERSRLWKMVKGRFLRK